MLEKTWKVIYWNVNVTRKHKGGTCGDRDMTAILVEEAHGERDLLTSSQSRLHILLVFRSHHTFLPPGQALLLVTNTHSQHGIPQELLKCFVIVHSSRSPKFPVKFFSKSGLIILHHLTLPWPNIKNQNIKNQNILSHCTCRKQQGTILNHWILTHFISHFIICFNQKTIHTAEV